MDVQSYLNTDVALYFLEDYHLEQLWISIQINKVKYIFGVVYHPPPECFIRLCELGKFLYYLSLKTDTLILVGKLNITILNLILGTS